MICSPLSTGACRRRDLGRVGIMHGRGLREQQSGDMVMAGLISMGVIEGCSCSDVY